MAPVQRRTRKQRRIQMLMLGGVMLAAATALVSFAFNDAIAFFRTPSELAEGGFDPSQRLRLGGLVADGSLVRGESETVRFSVVDGDGGEIEVTYTGILPDLFREGQGVVAEGYLRGGTFEAAEVLAKHDENYMPKEVADALKEQGHWKDEAAEPGS